MATMKRVLLIAVFTGALLNVVVFVFGVRPTAVGQLGFMLLIANTPGVSRQASVFTADCPSGSSRTGLGGRLPT